ncbi:MAG: hypothetical protein KJ593_07430 [Candidatus Omnitrophica bacterium]|nr:hypothetical protein [Candidatus Omnitrophota bacterium]
MDNLKRSLLEANFVRFLWTNLSSENFEALKNVCGGKMSSYFGFYENLEVGFNPYCDNIDFFAALSTDQINAFYEAFKVLKEKAPSNVLNTIRQFCHY